MIQLENIKKQFKDKDSMISAVNNVSLQINKGDIVIIIGESGAGKTTLLNIIGLIQQHFEGTYSLNGKPVSELNNHELSILRNEFFGYIFQNYLLIENDTAYENIRVPLLYSKKFKNKKDKIEEVAKSLNIQHLLKKNVTKLSGGERQRVAIARAIVNEPEVILMDEPTGALNSELSKVVMDSIYDYVKKNNKTLIIVTHDLQRVVRENFRKLVMKNGCIISDTLENKETYIF